MYTSNFLFLGAVPKAILKSKTKTLSNNQLTPRNVQEIRFVLWSHEGNVGYFTSLHDLKKQPQTWRVSQFQLDPTDLLKTSMGCSPLKVNPKEETKAKKTKTKKTKTKKKASFRCRHAHAARTEPEASEDSSSAAPGTEPRLCLMIFLNYFWTTHTILTSFSRLEVVWELNPEPNLNQPWGQLAVGRCDVPWLQFDQAGYSKQLGFGFAYGCWWISLPILI